MNINKFKRALSVICSVFIVSGFGGVACAQGDDSRLSRIENEIQTLSRAVFRGEMPVAGSVVGHVNSSGLAGTELRLQQIEIELRTLTGKIEQQNFQTKQLQGSVEKTIADMEMRIAELEEQLNRTDISVGVGIQKKPVEKTVTQPVSSGFETRAIKTDDKVIAPVPVMGSLGTLRKSGDDVISNSVTEEKSPGAIIDPAASYEQAFSFLRDRNYSEAGDAFQGFLDRHPDHDLAANAKYWLGETFYVRSDFERAARVFAEGYQQYPKGPKGPDNLLKLGMSLSGMGKTEDACLAYVQLRKEYSKGAIPILGRAEKEMDALGCK